MTANEIDLQPNRLKRTRGLAAIAKWVALFAAATMTLRLTGCMERLFYHPTVGPTRPSAQNRDAEKVTFVSRDGTNLCGWFLPAHDREPNSAPTILHAHGNAGNINDHIWFTDYLPAAGFNLFIFDYRGYGESAGTARTRRGLIEDTHAALDYLLSRTDIDRGRIGMYGQSLGGSIGLNVMEERPEIHAAAIESAFASWRDIAANAVGGDPPGVVGRALAWLLISDASRPDDAIRRCAPRPILIIHGDMDRIVPITHGRKLKTKGGSHVELVECAGGDHNDLRDSHPEIEQRVVAFFTAHLSD